MDRFDVYSNSLLLLRIARNLDVNSRSFYCFISWELKNEIALYVAIFTYIYNVNKREMLQLSIKILLQSVNILTDYLIPRD